MTLLYLHHVALWTALLPAAPWFDPTPTQPSEIQLRDLSISCATNVTPSCLTSWRALMAARPDSAVAGLAGLSAGLLLLDQNRPSEALPFLTHPAIARTALDDHAALAAGRAQALIGDQAKAAALLLDLAERGPKGPLTCRALLEGGAAAARAQLADRAREAMERGLTLCPNETPALLLQLARLHDDRKDYRAAAQAYSRLDLEYPLSTEARDAQLRLQALASWLPSSRLTSPPAFAKAERLIEAQRFSDAANWLAKMVAMPLNAEDRDRALILQGRALIGRSRWTEAAAALRAVAPNSPLAAESDFQLGRLSLRRSEDIAAMVAAVERNPQSPWAAQGLYTLAQQYQKDALYDQALPYFRRLLELKPNTTQGLSASWWVGWSDLKNGRYESAAQLWERAARTWATGHNAAPYLYWTARARYALNEIPRARQLFEETALRFKHTYYGMRANEALSALPPAAPGAPAPQMTALASEPVAPALAEPIRTRVAQLLLISRFDLAVDELRLHAPSSYALATIARLESRRGRLRPAIIAMKRAYPEYIGEAGDRLPVEIWRILFPIDFSDLLIQKARQQGLDPALVAAIIQQESTFDPNALSRAGARGLMQVIPPTGRQIARAKGVRYRRDALYDPAVSLDFGTFYLREVLDRFGQRPERALAAYNAGPHRVDRWTNGRPDMSAEEFIESIPFSETRHYVAIILAAQAQYRRLYPALSVSAQAERGAPPPQP